MTRAKSSGSSEAPPTSPPSTSGIAIRSAAFPGFTITPDYDSMIAKLIVWGADRKQALARMRRALAQYRVVGVSNNINFLSRLVALPSFVNAELDTGLIEREQGLLFPPQEEVPGEVWLVAALAELLHEQREVNSKFAAAAEQPAGLPVATPS